MSIDLLTIPLILICQEIKGDKHWKKYQWNINHHLKELDISLNSKSLRLSFMILRPALYDAEPLWSKYVCWYFSISHFLSHNANRVLCLLNFWLIHFRNTWRGTLRGSGKKIIVVIDKGICYCLDGDFFSQCMKAETEFEFMALNHCH